MVCVCQLPLDWSLDRTSGLGTLATGGRTRRLCESSHLLARCDRYMHNILQRSESLDVCYTEYRTHIYHAPWSMQLRASRFAFAMARCRLFACSALPPPDAVTRTSQAHAWPRGCAKATRFPGLKAMHEAVPAVKLSDSEEEINRAIVYRSPHEREAAQHGHGGDEDREARRDPERRLLLLLQLTVHCEYG
eukprot:3588566-Prymnesium_polylepis.1